MNKISVICLIAVLLTACKKEQDDLPPLHPSDPAMEYISLAGKETSLNTSQHMDLDKDGNRDFSFVTYYIGDPILKRDIVQFAANSTIDRLLLVNNNEHSPIFNKGDIISGNGPAGYNWYDIALTPLAEKIIEEQGAPYWVGPWKDANHKYLAFRMKKNGLYYNGWFELSMDTISEKLILFKAGVCKEPGASVRAGY
ncbi:MAG: hypothetical protein JWP81_3484 [Ferruginibacter sp.]|nr:hypothetical protein [Ferruginibacter sp.]